MNSKSKEIKRLVYRLEIAYNFLVLIKSHTCTLLLLVISLIVRFINKASTHLCFSRIT